MTSTNDPVGLTLASLGAGSATGAAVITAGMILFRLLPETGNPTEAADLGFLVITVSLLSGTAAAVAIGWLLTKGLRDMWRRAVVGALSAFGTALLAALTMPIDMVGGVPALTTYLVALIAGVGYARHAALRAASR
ncbi:MAG: hypothetical protein JSW71_13435 [Gemmatimonadota bacterium]|nr:MAG: hypothetical protein JSW71_13435 [Gemmatimonadota bacterium]